MAELLLGIVVVGSSVLLAIFGTEFVRRTMTRPFPLEEQGVAGHFFGAIGGFYGVLLAFLVVAIWGQFQDARVTVTREANQIGDIARMAQGFPADTRQNIQHALIDYTQAVIDDEWPAMSRGQESQRAWQSFRQLWEAFRASKPSDPREASLFDHCLFRLNELGDSRRARLFAAKERVPGLMWALLLLGGSVTIFSTCFFRLPSHLPQTLMVSALAGLIGFILFLIIDFDRPFSGVARVPPSALAEELQRIKTESGQ